MATSTIQAVTWNGVAVSLVLLAQASFATSDFLFLSVSPPITMSNGDTDQGSWTFSYHLAVSAVLVLVGGMFAGLTLGLMGLDELHLRVLANSSENITDKQNAQKVLDLLKRGRHWVLVALLLSNVIVNETLPILLDDALGGGVAAIAGSTTAIFIFGEVIPQAISVRYGLLVGATCAPLVLLMMFILAPVAYPMARFLDYVLGADIHQPYKKAELMSFIKLHRSAGASGDEPSLDDEVTILNAMLELNMQSVENIMTPLRDVVKLSLGDVLDRPTVAAMLQSGHSCFPVHKTGNPMTFGGFLSIKKLVMYDPSQNLPVSEFPFSILPEIHPSVNCFQAFHYFRTGRAHLLLVSRTPGIPGGAIGVITLEDVLQHMISHEEIGDERERLNEDRTTRGYTTSAIMSGIQVESPRSFHEAFDERAALLGRNEDGSHSVSFNSGHGQQRLYCDRHSFEGTFPRSVCQQ